MAKKRNKAKWIILGIFIFALVLFALNFNRIIHSKQDIIVTNAYVDPEISKAFNNGTKWVRVIVDLNSNEAADELLKSLTKSEFNFTSKSYFGNSLNGFTTIKGFHKIISSKNITAVYLDEAYINQA